MKMKWNENKIEYLGIERNNRIEELFVLYFKMVIFIIRLIVNILNKLEISYLHIFRVKI